MNTESLWAFIVSGLSALWMSFEKIHHLIYAILFILAVNLFLATVKSIKNCYIRRRRKKPFNIITCISEVGFLRILLEFAACSFGLFTISALDLIMAMGGHESPAFIGMLLQWITIFALILYGWVAGKRFGDIAPDLTIVRGVKYFFSKIKWWEKIPFGEDLEEGLKNGELEKIVNETTNSKDIKESK